MLTFSFLPLATFSRSVFTIERKQQEIQLTGTSTGGRYRQRREGAGIDWRGDKGRHRYERRSYR
jgi:hypothetical protein